MEHFRYSFGQDSELFLAILGTTFTTITQQQDRSSDVIEEDENVLDTGEAHPTNSQIDLSSP